MISYTAHQSKGIRLDANESSKNLPDWLIEEIIAELPSLEFNRYPDDSYKKLRDRYASLVGLTGDQVLAGTGSDQMLMLLISRFIKPGDVLATIDPDFGMYGFYDSLFHGKMDRFPIDLKKGINLKEWIAHLKTIQPSLVIFSNPHNPSGTMLSSTQVDELAKSLNPIPLCVDEAYMEFGQDSALDLIENNPNLYITRTLSKAYRLAGARVGFLLSQAKNIEDLLPFKIVYNLSSLSETAAIVALRHFNWFGGKAERTIQRREKFFEFLMENPYLDPIPSRANFICILSPYTGDLARILKENGISVRTFKDAEYLRISIGEGQEMEKVQRAIKLFEREMEKKHAPVIRS